MTRAVARGHWLRRTQAPGRAALDTARGAYAPSTPIYAFRLYPGTMVKGREASAQVATGVPAKTLAGPVHARPGTRLRAPPFVNPLLNCQIQTPPQVVKLVWTHLHRRRPSVASVIDLGAGDGRFAFQGRYESYVGCEIDPSQEPAPDLPGNARIIHKCVLDVDGTYEAAVGNPPFIRNQDIKSDWRERAAKLIRDGTGADVHGLANLYVYFMWLATLKTEPDGIAVLVVPYEWVSRPTAQALREYLAVQGWHVEVHRIPDGLHVFDEVKTTASITIIDKGASRRNGSFAFYEVRSDLKSRPKKGPTPAGRRPLAYVPGRGDVYPSRGFSPGSQAVFCLTDDERREAGLRLSQVLPAVTSLRHVPTNVRVLDADAFEAYYVDAEKKCWLLRTGHDRISRAAKTWLKKAPGAVKTNSTCAKRDPWYRYADPPAPRVLYAAGFTRRRPKIVVNGCGARNVGSVHGLFGPVSLPRENELLRHLRELDFASRIVPHSGGFRKIEVAQMNGVVTAFYSRNGSAHA